jgi:hypothetical protein
MHHAFKTTAFALAFIATAASAEGVRTERNMSLDLANQIAAPPWPPAPPAATTSPLPWWTAPASCAPAARRQRRPAHLAAQAKAFTSASAATPRWP